MSLRRARSAVLLAVGALLVVGVAAPALASPAPISACPPCDRGFVQAASEHGLDTEVAASEATVRVHDDGSATWTARVRPTNDTVTDRLAANASLARAVAADSFGVRYGPDIDHELLGVAVADGVVTVRYRTLDVVEDGPFGTRVLTYFRDTGGYVYTDLGADELTVVGPDGTTVAHGFGEASGDRLVATELPGVQDGPFVVFAPAGTPGFLTGGVGLLAVGAALGGVIARNLLLFVAVPGAVLVGGLAGVRRWLAEHGSYSPTALGAVVAVGGAALLAAGALEDGLTLLGGAFGGAVVAGATLLAVGAGVALRPVRRRLTGTAVLGAAAAGLVGAAAVETVLGPGGARAWLTLASGLVPAVVGLGWVDARGGVGAATTGWLTGRRAFAAVAVAVLAGLVAVAPLTALGGTLFIVLPALLTVGAVVAVVAAVPLYLLGRAAGADPGEA